MDGMQHRRTLDRVLQEEGLITREQMHVCQQEYKKTGECMAAIIVGKGYLTNEQLVEVLRVRMGIPRTTLLNRVEVDDEVIGLLPVDFLKSRRLFPLVRKGGHLTLAMADPLDEDAIRDIRLTTGLVVVPVLASVKELEWAIRQYIDPGVDKNLKQAIRELKKNTGLLYEGPTDYDAGVYVDDAPVIKVVNTIFARAVQEKASDIHIEPQEDGVRVRFRIDGSLFDILHLPRHTGPAIISRIKIMADLDISEKRLPQDGRMRITVEQRDIDFRIASLPTIYGEKLVLRILDQAEGILSLTELRLGTDNLAAVKSLMRYPHGIILISGPTGSGKTTTLYAMLSFLNSRERNIVTLEEPVEYSLAGIIQVQVNPRIGFTFASGLRAVLRQDPDIIMVGEIRDTETARLATRAAMTGHLVLSTLHTNTAAGSLARLLDMGVEPYLIASALKGVVAQRLVRMNCPHCSEVYTLEEHAAVKLDISENEGRTFYRGRGCDFCRMTGYRGRAALQEVLLIDKAIRELIIGGRTSEEQLQEKAVTQGMVTLREDGIRKAAEGLTSLEEVMKVVYLGD